MNERIKELVVESGNGLMRNGKLYPYIGIRFEEDWQRFAELIVRECLSYAKDGDLDFMKFMIKKHFGVEE